MNWQMAPKRNKVGALFCFVSILPSRNVRNGDGFMINRERGIFNASVWDRRVENLCKYGVSYVVLSWRVLLSSCKVPL